MEDGWLTMDNLLLNWFLVAKACDLRLTLGSITDKAQASGKYSRLSLKEDKICLTQTQLSAHQGLANIAVN